MLVDVRGNRLLTEYTIRYIGMRDFQQIYLWSLLLTWFNFNPSVDCSDRQRRPVVGIYGFIYTDGYAR